MDERRLTPLDRAEPREWRPGARYKEQDNG
jgi:hypothetical protein